jgi:modulator of FtsH protease
MTQLSDWQTLLAVQAGAAATLTGLVFVAVSINLSRIIAFPGLASRAAESVGQFLQVFFICTAALIPRQPIAVLGIEILSIALFSWAMQLIALIQHSNSWPAHPHLWLVIRIAQTQLPSIPLFVAGVYLLLGLPTGLYWLVPGFVFSFLAAVVNAWVLLVEVLR